MPSIEPRILTLNQEPTDQQWFRTVGTEVIGKSGSAVAGAIGKQGEVANGYKSNNLRQLSPHRFLCVAPSADLRNGVGAVARAGRYQNLATWNGERYVFVDGRGAVVMISSDVLFVVAVINAAVINIVVVVQ